MQKKTGIPCQRIFLNPIFFFVLLLLPTLLYFSGFTYWLLLQLLLQVFFCLVGFLIPNWKSSAFVILTLIILFNASWIRLDRNIPDSCRQQIDEFTGVAAEGFHLNPKQLQLIKVEIWCKGERTRWPQAFVDFSNSSIKNLKWHKIGDRINLVNIRIRSVDFPYIFIAAESKKISIYNGGSQERFLNRSALFLYIQNKADYYLNSLHSALFKALITADRSELPIEWKTRFQQLGVAHLFAISGMHVGILYLWISFTLRLAISFPWSWIEKGYGDLFVDLLSILIIYMFLDLIGMPITAARALIMLIWWIVAKHFMSWQPLWFILVGTALLILIKDPLAVGQFSFQLSFLSVAGILMILPFLPRRRLDDSLKTAAGKAISSSLIISFWLFLLTFPLVDFLAPDHSFMTVINNVIHISFLSFVYLPVIVLSLVFTALGYQVYGLPGEFIIYSIVNFSSKAWTELMLWNDSWNRYFLWNPDWSWHPYRIIIYWILLILCLYLPARLVRFRINKNRPI